MAFAVPIVILGERPASFLIGSMTDPQDDSLVGRNGRFLDATEPHQLRRALGDNYRIDSVTDDHIRDRGDEHNRVRPAESLRVEDVV
jgi:hypothetical protein